MDKWIVANWKMNGTLSFAEKYIAELAPIVAKTSHHVIVCPPHPLLAPINNLKNGTSIFLGGQNCYFQESGAFTGEVSPALLADLGCTFVILGHSERRTLFGETSDVVAKKALLAQQNGLTPIICVGESLEDREAGRALEVVIGQLTQSIPETTLPYLIAYEPIWAIGTGKVATLQDIEDMHRGIKESYKAPVLYGGSVNSQNSADILNCPNVDGVLIGGASLKIPELEIIIGKFNANT